MKYQSQVVIILILLLLFLTGCAYYDSERRMSSNGQALKITENTSAQRPPNQQIHVENGGGGPTYDLELTIATIKDEYFVGADVDLTDPPSEQSSQHLSSKYTDLADSVSFAEEKKSNNIELINPIRNSFYVSDGKNRIMIRNSWDEVMAAPSSENLLHAEAFRWKKLSECKKRNSKRQILSEVPLKGANIEQKTRSFLTANPTYNIDEKNLFVRERFTYPAKDFEYISYEQKYKGIPVLWSEVGFVIKNENLVLLNSNSYKNIDIDTQPKLSEQQALQTAQQAFGVISNPLKEPRLVIFPLSNTENSCDYSYVLTYEVELPEKHTVDGVFNPTAYIDAKTGHILEVLDRTRYEIVSGTARGEIYPEHPLEEQIIKEFPHELIWSQNHQTYSNTDGAFSFEVGTDNEIQSQLKGFYVRILNSGQEESSFLTSIPPYQFDIDWNDHDFSYMQEESNVYYHANVIHDFFTRGTPFNIYSLDYQMPALVNITGTCNAYYDGYGINFYSAGGGCESLALSSDVIYHEYTHAMVDNVIYVGFPYWGHTGNMNEGYADYYACSLNNNPCLSEYMFFGQECLRNCENTKRYPEDYDDEPHAGAEIISGSIWDVRQVLGQEEADILAILALKLQPQTFSELLENFLITDDNDGNLSNGTPNIEAICGSFFTNHGIWSDHCLGYTERPLAVITSPFEDETVSDVIDIIGTAHPSTYNTGAPGSFSYEILGNTFDTPVFNDVLYSWNTLEVPEGIATIVLTVVDSDSPFPSSTYSVDVLVDNITAISPLNNNFYAAGDTIEVRAEVNFAGATDFNLSFYPEDDPADVSIDGIVLQNGGVYAGDSLLGYWEIPEVSEGTFYILKIEVFDSQEQHAAETIKIFVDPDLKIGWPVRIPFLYIDDPDNPYYCFSGHAYEASIGDVDGDAEKEIVVYSIGSPPKINIFNSDGTLLNSWQESDTTNCHFTNHPLLVDIDSDGLDEIIVFDRTFCCPGETSLVYAYNYDGSIVPGWPVTIPHDFNPTIIAADLDLDNNPEIIVKGNSAFGEGTVTIISNDGNIISQWNPINSTAYASTMGSPTVGNFDDDPELEIVLGIPQPPNGKLVVYNRTGSVVSGWPVTLPGYPLSSPVVGDLDGDGSLDIVIGLMARELLPDNGGLWAFNKNGETLSGWPKFLGQEFWSTPSLFDLDEDGDLEIGISSLGSPFRTYILDHEGNELNGWPQNTIWNDYYSSVFGSINNGDFGLVTTASKVYAWDVQGSILEGYPKDSEGDTQAPALIKDIDNDNLTELIASSNWNWNPAADWRLKLWGSVYVWETESELNEDKQEWPMFHHDNQLTGNYDYISPQQRPKSQILSHEDFDVTGLLTMKVQKRLIKELKEVYPIPITQESETPPLPEITPQQTPLSRWKDVAIIVENSEQIVPANGYLALDEIWNPLGWTITEVGRYRIYTEFKIGTQTLGDTYEFSVVSGAICGNGILEVGEECDDGNLIEEDGCNGLCVIEFCGDGIVQLGLGEECDDGNNIDGDGCSSTCITEEPVGCAPGDIDNGDGTCTADFNATIGDGFVRNRDSSWEQVHDASSGDEVGPDWTIFHVSSEHHSAVGFTINRGFIPFDTSNLPDTATIISAELKVYVTATENEDDDGEDFVVMVHTSQDDVFTLTNQDFDQCGSVMPPVEEGSNRVDFGNLVLQSYNIFTFNSLGIDWINPQGFTMLGLREGHDILNSQIDTDKRNFLNIKAVEDTFNAVPPKLIVTYSNV